MSRFKDGTAGDLLCWHSESFKQIFAHEHGRLALLTMAQGIVTGTLPEHVTQMATMARVVPLRKSFQDQRIRPICVPSVFRKLIAHTCLYKVTPQVTAHVQGEQYGLQRKDGCDVLRHAVKRLSTSCPSWCMFKTDIANAFNAADRSQLLTGMQKLDPVLAAVSQHWLRTPSLSAVLLESEEYVILNTATG
eukprot:5035957-Amphidinium_carterae.1